MLGTKSILDTGPPGSVKGEDLVRDIHQPVEDPPAAQPGGEIALRGGAFLQLGNLVLELVVVPGLLLEEAHDLVVRRLQALAACKKNENKKSFQPCLSVGTPNAHPLVDR